MTVDEIVVEISVCVGSAVCGNEELRTVKIRGADRGILIWTGHWESLLSMETGVECPGIAALWDAAAWEIVRLMEPGHPVNSGFGAGASEGAREAAFLAAICAKTASWS